MYEAKIICDSISPKGHRLTTFEVEYPHAVHKEIMTHRCLSRNFKSFRAYPPEKVIENIKRDPFFPEEWHARVPGMGEGDAIKDYDKAQAIWWDHIIHSTMTAEAMMKLNLAKAQVNFVLQDLTWIRGLITATEWDNFWRLRTADDVRPEVNKIAKMMKAEYDAGTPTQLGEYDWHLPLIQDDDREHHELDSLKKISVGRCARVSYLTHDGVRAPEQDIRLHDSLMVDGHMSPFEHVARPMIFASCCLGGPNCPSNNWGRNFRGWHQYRSYVENYDDAI